MPSTGKSHQVRLDNLSGIIPTIMDVQSNALDRAVARIVDAMRPEAIYLFGSHARSQQHPDSDYDFLVVVSDDAPPETGSLAASASVERDPGIALDIVPCRRSVFERKRHLLGSVSYLATHEGHLVYER